MVAAIGIFSKNSIFMCYTAAWWAFHYCPGGWVARLHASPPVYATTKAMRSTLRVTTIAHRVNAACKLYPGILAAALILGTLGGCGGKLIVDAFSHCAGYKQGVLRHMHASEWLLFL